MLQHRREAVRGQPTDCLLELNVDHLPADVRRFFLERDVASIVMTVSEFALPVVARYADQVIAEVALDKDVAAAAAELAARRRKSSSAARTTVCIFRARCSTSRCRRRINTRWRLCVAQCDVLMQRNEQRRGITAVVRSKLFRESGGLSVTARGGR